MLGDFVASFEEKKTGQMFVRGGIQGSDRTVTQYNNKEEYKLDGSKEGGQRVDGKKVRSPYILN